MGGINQMPYSSLSKNKGGAFNQVGAYWQYYTGVTSQSALHGGSDAKWLRFTYNHQSKSIIANIGSAQELEYTVRVKKNLRFRSVQRGHVIPFFFLSGPILRPFYILSAPMQ